MARKLDQMPRGQQRSGYGGGGARGPSLLKIVVGVVALVIIYLVASSYLSGAPVTDISTSATLNITNATQFFTLNGNEYATYLISAKPSASVQIAIAKVPVLLTPILNVSLFLANSTDVNGFDQWTNMRLTLEKKTNNSAEVLFVSVLEAEYISPSAGRISYMQSLLPSILAAKGNAANSITTTVAATTTAGSTTTATTVTTSISGQSGNYSAAMGVLKTALYYPILVNYTRIYANESQCSPALYNSTYAIRYGHAPSSPNTYADATQLVPYALNMTLAQSANAVWAATYTTLSHSSFTTGKAVVITLNITSKGITGTSIPLAGVFGGLNYTQILSGYTGAKNVRNACGILITSCQSPC